MEAEFQRRWESQKVEAMMADDRAKSVEALIDRIEQIKPGWDSIELLFLNKLSLAGQPIIENEALRIVETRLREKGFGSGSVIEKYPYGRMYQFKRETKTGDGAGKTVPWPR